MKTKKIIPLIQITSMQIHGDGIGSKHFVPTINLVIPIYIAQSSLSHGIYAARCTLRHLEYDHTYEAAVHYGPRPVIHDAHIVLEVHILTTQPKIPAYDKKHIHTALYHYIRPVLALSPQDLRMQIDKDIHDIRQILRAV